MQTRSPEGSAQGGLGQAVAPRALVLLHCCLQVRVRRCSRCCALPPAVRELSPHPWDVSRPPSQTTRCAMFAARFLLPEPSAGRVFPASVASREGGAQWSVWLSGRAQTLSRSGAPPAFDKPSGWVGPTNWELRGSQLPWSCSKQCGVPAPPRKGPAGLGVSIRAA